MFAMMRLSFVALVYALCHRLILPPSSATGQANGYLSAMRARLLGVRPHAFAVF